jgi:hypothetical protein
VPGDVKALIGRVVGALSGALFKLGCKLDLHPIMTDLGACTSSVALVTTLARLMLGAAIPIAIRLSVAIGAISQVFGGAYQDCAAIAGYFKRHTTRPHVAVPRERKGTGSWTNSHHRPRRVRSKPSSARSSPT